MGFLGNFISIKYKILHTLMFSCDLCLLFFFFVPFVSIHLNMSQYTAATYLTYNFNSFTNYLWILWSQWKLPIPIYWNYKHTYLKARRINFLILKSKDRNWTESSVNKNIVTQTWVLEFKLYNNSYKDGLAW